MQAVLLKLPIIVTVVVQRRKLQSRTQKRNPTVTIREVSHITPHQTPTHWSNRLPALMEFSKAKMYSQTTKIWWQLWDDLQPLPFHRVSWMHATSTFLSDNASTTSPVSESTFQVQTQNPQPFRSPLAPGRDIIYTTLCPSTGLCCIPALFPHLLFA